MASHQALNHDGPARGPLGVAAANPRYFTVASNQSKAVYLTGSHIWNNLHDGMGPGAGCAEAPEPLDYDAYLDFLAEHGHNFVRLWRWEQVRSQAAGGDFHLCMTPQPWPRTGPGAARDGKPKFDLDRFDEAFFTRLRDRVAAAGKRGIYVAVMLFDGWALHLSPAPDQVEGHPFHATNNINGVGIGSIVDYQVLPLDPRIQQLQEAYVHKVVETLHGLPNLLWEVANESSGGGKADPAFAEMLGQAGTPEWGDSTMAPGSPQSRWLEDPPAADGRKVVISDTDHYAPGLGDALWAWKTFLRGHHPILMDFGIIGGVNPPDPLAGGPMSYAAFEAARYAMGDTRRYAERMDLLNMEPRADLSSTGYALANPGQEYLVLQPDQTADPFTVTLDAGTYAVEWLVVDSRQTVPGQPRIVDGSTATSFAAPAQASGPTVLHLKRVAG
jgi:hypothetical protein